MAKKKTPQYQTELLAAYIVIGFLLMALGAISLLSITGIMKGVLRKNAAAITFGLGGSFAFMVPVFFIWGGVITALSANRKVSKRAFLLVLGAFLVILSILNLLSRIGSVDLMNYLTSRYSFASNSGWIEMIGAGYMHCSLQNPGGGALGMLLAWPAWKTIGIIPGTIILSILAIGLLFLFGRFDILRIYKNIQEKAAVISQKKQVAQEQEAQQQRVLEQQQRFQQNIQAEANQVYSQQIQRNQQQSAQFYPGGPNPYFYQQNPNSQQLYCPSPAQQPYRPVQPPQPGYLQKNQQQGDLYDEVITGDQGMPDWVRRSQQGARWNQQDPAVQEKNASERRAIGRIESTRRQKSQQVQQEHSPQTAVFTTLNEAEWQNAQVPREVQTTVFDKPVQQNMQQTDDFDRLFGAQNSAQTDTVNEVLRSQPTTTVQSMGNPNLYANRPGPATTESVDESSNYSPLANECVQSESKQENPYRRSSLQQKAEPEKVFTPAETPEQQSQPTLNPFVREMKAEPVPEDKTDIQNAHVPAKPLPSYAPKRIIQLNGSESSAENEQPSMAAQVWQPKAERDNPKEVQPEAPSYVIPPVDLLAMPSRKAQQDTAEIDTESAHRLEKTLESFGIPAVVQRVTHGPAVTRFELGLVSSGINVKRIMSIADNIALDLAANGGVRIEIPIPGTNLFGVEVPNREVQAVSLREVLETPEFMNAKSPLAVCLGKDIAGKPVICDLAKMPHLLIAGQTGSGKSVCINTIINSLLYRTNPEDVRMIMIDPKVVELQCYNDIPHLLIPVVSDPHKAAGALQWAVAEMLDRYHKMQTKNVREVNAYNAKLEPGEQKLPRIIIVIDELADLMLACKKEVEESIIRIAQLARAAGIHMIVATQRPTVDVITGLIKANIPSRIAFAVASSLDSRTILDQNGAEKLLGRGDMFYFPTGASAPVRVQGCYLSDAEIEKIVGFIAAHSEKDYDPSIAEQLEGGTEEEIRTDDSDNEGVDEKLAEAIDIVISDGQASISMLQRRMKIGYARAGRLIDDMAARGIISRNQGSKPREILISREEYEQIKSTLIQS